MNLPVGRFTESKPTATAARFDEPEPAATNSKTKSKATTTSREPARRLPTGRPAVATKVKGNGKGSNHRHRKNVHQAAQVDYQRESIVVAQHAAAVRDVGGRLIEQRLFGG
jgi:hypothetical protein